MPWCETCSRWYSPNALNTDGTCPTCGRPVAAPPEEAAGDQTPAADWGEVVDHKIPWHFWVLVVGAVIYLTYRLVQGIIWLGGHL